MLFHTWPFLVFFAVFYAVYLGLRRTRYWLHWMFVASYVFYGWWNPLYLVLILYSTLGDRRPARFRVVDDACRVLYDAVLADPRSGFAYSAEEICLDGMCAE